MMASPLAPQAREIAASVSERETLRLLGLPRGRALEGDLLDRAEGARDWYARHADPFVATRRVALLQVEGDAVHLEGGVRLASAVLAARLASAEAHGLLALAATAGPAVADEVKRLWAEERPDEAYFLDRFAAAVTERLVFWASGEVCRASEAKGETLLPHLSPGCGQWDLADQHQVMRLLAGPRDPARETVRLGPMDLLPSGALHPQYSLLAVLGVTRRRVEAAPEDLCRACDLDPCGFRRAPFQSAAPLPLESR